MVFVRVIAWADAHKPRSLRRIFAPTLALGALGAVSIEFPQLLGNGKDIAELAFTNQVPPLLMLTLFVLKPLATVLCLGSGVPGGLFTPSLAMGALLGGCLGAAWSLLWPGVPLGLLCDRRGGGRVGGHHSRTYFVRGADDGVNRPRPLLHLADALGRRHRNGGRAHPR